jgi:hypothetical protein
MSIESVIRAPLWCKERICPQLSDIMWICQKFIPSITTPKGLKQLRQNGVTILKYQTKEIQGLLKHVYLDSLPPYQAPTGE